MDVTLRDTALNIGFKTVSSRTSLAAACSGDSTDSNLPPKNPGYYFASILRFCFNAFRQ